MKPLIVTCFVFCVSLSGCSEHVAEHSSSSPQAGDALTSNGQGAVASKPFIDEKQTIPPMAEWNREIVAKRPGTVKIRVTGQAPKSIIVMTTKGFRAVLAGGSDAFDKEKDVLLVDETTETTYEKDVDFPAGSFHLMMQNRAAEPQEFQLQCAALSNG